MAKVIQNNEPIELEKVPTLELTEPIPLTSSESGVELKSLLKLIDNVIEAAPATDNEESEILPISENENENENSSSIELEDGKVLLKETLMVPVKKYPKYNFVGRILGPRGMTVKQLERETGCKIFVRGRASSTSFNPHTKSSRLSPFANCRATLSTISQSALTDDPLHVYIECLDYPELAEQKMQHALSIINELLSPPADGKDELKRQQLVDISLINGTYRATSSSNELLRQLQSRKWGQSVDPTSDSVDFPLRAEMSASNGDLGSVYGIAQQRRIWQKPRGPDSSTEEYAKSVSSREYVTDIVNKTKKSPQKQQSDEAMFTLSESVVSETLKVAQNLLASHPSYNKSEEKNEAKILGSGDAAPSSKRVAKNDFRPSGPMCPPPPGLPPMSYPSDLYFSHAPASFVDFPPPPPMFYMFPPPPPHFNRRPF